MVQSIIRVMRVNWSTGSLASIGCLLLFGCGPDLYLGRMQSSQASPTCPAGRSLLALDGPRFVLTPDDGTMTIVGTQAGGHLHGERPLAGNAAKPGHAEVGTPALVFDAIRHGDHIDGSLSKPGCRRSLSLERS